MGTFQVIEQNEGIEQAVLQGLSRWSGMQESGLPDRPALLAISPRAAQSLCRLPDACRTVLLPGNATILLQDLQAASVVSYGASPRDSLTLSSCLEERLMVALQRELVTVDGQVVERQEFPLRQPKQLETWSTLAATGTLLLLGIPPEELMEGGNIQLGT